MPGQPNRGPVVVDTDVYSARLPPTRPSTAATNRSSSAASSSSRFRLSPKFATALSSENGVPRVRRMEAEIARTEIVHSGGDLIRVYADLRVACQRTGHALCQREHDADRWIAATALRLGIPLVSNDGIFEDTPGLALQTA